MKKLVLLASVLFSFTMVASAFATGATNNATPTSYKKEVLAGTHTVANTYKYALIKASPTGTYDATTTNYSNVTGNVDEAVCTGYTPGGKIIGDNGTTVAAPTISSVGTTAIMDFAPTSLVWTITGTCNVQGAIIYNATQSGRAVSVIDFGGVVSATNSTLTVTAPASGATTSAIQIR